MSTFSILESGGGGCEAASLKKYNDALALFTIPYDEAASIFTKPK